MKLIRLIIDSLIFFLVIFPVYVILKLLIERSNKYD